MGLDLNSAEGQNFGPAGANHAPGLVPDPGSTAHSPAQLLGDDGNFHAPFSLSGQAVDIEILIDGGGSAIATGHKGKVHVPIALNIVEWRVMADQSGSIAVDVLRANNAVPSASIVGSGNAPTLSASQFSIAAPSGWTSTALAADDWLDFNVTSATTVTQATVVLSCQRP